MPTQRYTVINSAALLDVFGSNLFEVFQQSHQSWITSELNKEVCQREAVWSQSLAVGDKLFVERVQAALNVNACHRENC